MGSRVVQDPSIITMYTTPDGTPAAVQLANYVMAVRIATTADEIDVSTFSRFRTQLGQVKHTISFALLWSPEMVSAMTPSIGDEVEFQLQEAEDVAASKAIIWRASYAFIPFGNWEMGSRVEHDLPLAVLGDPEYKST